MPSPITFQILIRRKRRALGLTQAQLAAMLDISHRTLDSWERSEKNHQPHILTQEAVWARIAAFDAPPVPLDPLDPALSASAQGGGV